MIFSFAQIVPPIDPGETSLIGVLDNIVGYLYWLSFPIAVLAIIYSAFLFLTSGGSENQIRKARDVLIYTFVGFLIIVLASGVIGIIESQFGN